MLDYVGGTTGGLDKSLRREYSKQKLSPRSEIPHPEGDADAIDQSSNALEDSMKLPAIK